LNIQIATIGLTPEVVRTGLQKVLPDKLYIIHTKDEELKSDQKVETNATNLKKEIESDYKIQVILRKVEKFDSRGVIYQILQIISEEKKANKKLQKKDFTINITGGTKAMVAGAACAAYLAQTKMYYVLHPDEAKGREMIIELPVLSRAENNNQGKTEKTSSFILEKISMLSPTNNGILLEKLNDGPLRNNKIPANGLSYHLKKLEEKKLITVNLGWKYRKDNIEKINKKLRTIEITELGKYYADFPDLIGEEL